jgi:UDP-N-acetylglucosamine--N-acetylmuramyl-(pentapeptide) pyrophosphoryl-undecaprenol N-acetylglucosamine transferase
MAMYYKEKDMSIVLSGGGTGGHLAIVRSIKEELKSSDIELVYIGSTKGQDKAWFENDSDFDAVYFLESKGVVNQKGLGKLKSLWMMLKSMQKAKQIFKSHDTKVVLSVGGFSAAPGAFGAITSRIPLVIHEQNAALGTLNKIIKPYAHTFISSYDSSSPISSYPIKDIYFQSARRRDEIKSIIFLGGSQGAVAINNLALELAPVLNEKGIKIIHQAGERNIQKVQEEYSHLGIEADVFGFSDKLAEYIAKADFAVARAGASTLWELSANGLPALYIPYPYAASDHQYYNAKFLVDQNLAWLIRESELDSSKVLEILDQDISKISAKLIDSVNPNGAKEIAKLLISLHK